MADEDDAPSSESVTETVSDDGGMPAGDSYTETTSQGWFSRLGDAIKGVLFGLLLAIVAFPLLFWNEGRAVRTAKSLAEGRGAVVAASAERLDPANEGKLVHVAGRARTEDTVADPLFGVQAPAIIERAPKEGASDERALTAVLDWTLEHEMIQRMPDFLFVSTYLGHQERWDERLLAHLAEDMGKRLGWDANRQREEVALTLKIVAMPRG